MAQHFDNFVQAHPFAAERPELAELANSISDQLAEFNQAIWRAKE